MNNTNASLRPAFAARLRRAAPDDPMRLPLLLWAAVLLAGMLTVYVHLVLSQVARGERLREEQRARVEMAGNTGVKRQAEAPPQGARSATAGRSVARPA